MAIGIISPKPALSIASFEATVLPFCQNKPILWSSDLDGTLLRWLEHNKQLDITAYRSVTETLGDFENDVILTIKTGRGLSALKIVAHYLTDIPLGLLSLNNGQELYINHHHQPATEWIMGLSLTDQDPLWKDYLRQQHGWQLPQLIQAFHQIAQQHQFTSSTEWPNVHRYHQQTNFYIDHGQNTLLEFFNDEASLMVKSLTAGPLPDSNRTHGQVLVAQVVETMKQLGIDVDYDVWPDDRFDIYLFSPQGISKATKLQALISRLTHIKAIVSSGDHSNDWAMIAQPQYERQDPDNPNRVEHVPNFAIQSGSRLDFQQLLNQNPHAQHAQELGYLAHPLRHQLQCALAFIRSSS